MSTPPNRFTEETKSALETILENRRRLQDKRKVLEAELSAVDRAIADSKVEYEALYNKDAPVLSLPDEITSLIFWFSVCSVLDADGLEQVGPFYQRRMEVVVSHVCQRWRSNALDLPCIWSTFSAKTEEGNPHLPIDRFKGYLGRSKTRLLDLSFDFRKGQDPGDTRKAEESAELIRMAIPHSERWYRLHILGAGEIQNQILHAIWELENISTPNLIYFACHNAQDREPQPTDPWVTLTKIEHLQPVLFQGGAPKLASLLVDRTALSLGLPPLSNITTLRMEEQCNLRENPFVFNARAFLEIVSIPGLINLSIYGTFCCMDDLPAFLQEMGRRGVVASRLRHLRVASSESMIRLLPLIEAPQLETMALFSIRYQQLDFSPPTTRFPALHSLTLDDCIIPDPESFLHLSQLTPNVVNLTIEQKIDPFNGHADRWLRKHKTAWPLLGLVNMNMADPDIAPYLEFIEAPYRPQFTFALHRYLLKMWRQESPAELALLEKRFNIVELPKSRPPGHQWPPHEDSSGWLGSGYDPFPSGSCRK